MIPETRIENGFQFMGRKTEYKTKQKEALLNYIRSRGHDHLTASDIHEYLTGQGFSIGLTTVYRNLDKLVAEGTVTRYSISDNVPACYEYTGAENGHDETCMHCICIGCGRVMHVHCHEMEHMKQHMEESHSFFLIPQRSLFYGFCEECGKTRTE